MRSRIYPLGMPHGLHALVLPILGLHRPALRPRKHRRETGQPPYLLRKQRNLLCRLEIGDRQGIHMSALRWTMQCPCDSTTM